MTINRKTALITSLLAIVMVAIAGTVAVAKYDGIQAGRMSHPAGASLPQVAIFPAAPNATTGIVSGANGAGAANVGSTAIAQPYPLPRRWPLRAGLATLRAGRRRGRRPQLVGGCFQRDRRRQRPARRGPDQERLPGRPGQGPNPGFRHRPQARQAGRHQRLRAEPALLRQPLHSARGLERDAPGQAGRGASRRGRSQPAI